MILFDFSNDLKKQERSESAFNERNQHHIKPSYYVCFISSSQSSIFQLDFKQLSMLELRKCY